MRWACSRCSVRIETMHRLKMGGERRCNKEAGDVDEKQKLLILSAFFEQFVEFPLFCGGQLFYLAIIAVATAPTV